MNKNKLLTVKKVVKILNYHPQTIYKNLDKIQHKNSIRNRQIDKKNKAKTLIDEPTLVLDMDKLLSKNAIRQIKAFLSKFIRRKKNE